MIFRRFSAALTGILLIAGCDRTSRPVTPEEISKAEEYLDALTTYVNTALTKGRDDIGTETPLFYDGLNLETMEPVTWSYDHHEWVLANLANQQHLLRTMVGLSELTGDPTFKDEAAKTFEFAFENLVTPNGLLLWGGHTSYDARGEEWVGRRYHWLGKKRSPVHELKANYPYYELMWEVDKKATQRFIRSFWENHLRNWENLDFDRHGGVNKPKTIDESVWERQFNEDSPVFFTGEGRTFVNAASDLFLAGAMLYELDGEKGALEWSKRLISRYEKARHPETGLRGYQFSIPEVDRAELQFGDQLPGKTVHEAYIFEPNSLAGPLYTQLVIFEKLGNKGEAFKRLAVEDLVAIGKYAFNKENGRMRRMLLDGTDISNVVLPRNGYFGLEGQVVGDWPADDFFFVYCKALEVVGDSAPESAALWEMAREIGKICDLGDIGDIQGMEIDLNFETTTNDPEMIIGLLDLFSMTSRKAYLDLACKVGDEILENRFENGLFKFDQPYLYTRLSRSESLAMLHLAAELMGKRDRIPKFMDSAAFFACELKSTDSAYTFDHNVIYPVLKPGASLKPQKKPDTGTD